MLKKLLISLISLLILTVLSVTFVYAYFHRQQDLFSGSELVGEVIVLDIVSFEGSEEVNNVSTIGAHKKIGVYEVDVANPESENLITNLRIDFQVNSNIDTYFRIRLIDTLTIVYQNAVGKTVELVLPTDEQITYEINSENWYYDAIEDWFYFKTKVTPSANNIISFITEGLEYPFKNQAFKMQIGIIIEAVQAVRGPEENWGLLTKPWTEGDSWT